MAHPLANDWSCLMANPGSAMALVVLAVGVIVGTPKHSSTPCNCFQIRLFDIILYYVLTPCNSLSHLGRSSPSGTAPGPHRGGGGARLRVSGRHGLRAALRARSCAEAAGAAFLDQCHCSLRENPDDTKDMPNNWSFPDFKETNVPGIYGVKF